VVYFQKLFIYSVTSSDTTIRYACHRQR